MSSYSSWVDLALGFVLLFFSRAPQASGFSVVPLVAAMLVLYTK